MSAVPARIYTIEEIHASVYGFQNINWRTDSHKVSRLLLRKLRHHCIQDTVHFFVGLAYRQPTDRLAIQIKLPDCLCMPDTDIFIDSALIDTEQKLVLIDRIWQTVKTLHLLLLLRQKLHKARESAGLDTSHKYFPFLSAADAPHE